MGWGGDIMATGYDMQTELWKMCAGPLIDFIKVEHEVYYFPQGHLEQFHTSTEHDSDELQFSLPSKIRCRVMDVQLKAEQDTDDAYAQITLLPEEYKTESTYIDSLPVKLLRATVHSFCKALTASDISTRHGLYVPREHANKCFPSLDMSEKIPEQILVAKDIHGIKWTFKHTFRGQHPRHTLTTGWNAFVTSKGLTTGDSVIFLRGEDGELHVGVKRLAYPQRSILSSGISSDSVQKKLQTVQAVAYAIHARSRFVVNCKPRLSQFIITVNKYVEALQKNFSIGMKVKMPFWVEDPLEKRLTGTIVANGDICPEKWPNSMWRCLKIRWNGSPSYTRPENVSPWEIEPLQNFLPTSTKQIGETLISNEMHLPLLQKGKRKLQEEPEEQDKDIDVVVTMRPHWTRASFENPREGLLESCSTTAEECPELAYDKRIGMDNDTTNVKEYAIVKGTNSRGSLTNQLSANLLQYETQPQPQGTSTNQIPISDINGKGQLDHMLNFDVPNSVSLDNVLAPCGCSMWSMSPFRGFDPAEIEHQTETSTHLQPLPENTDQYIPIDGTLPLACQSASSNAINISSIPSLIPYNGPGLSHEQVSWASYLVARRCIPILDRIMTRYPELLLSFRATSDVLQSMLLEILAEVVDKLERVTVGNIDQDQLDVAKRYLSDLKMGGLEVDWIEKRLQQINAVFKKGILVQRQAELNQEVEMTSTKCRELMLELESVDKELQEVTSNIGTNPLSAEQSVMQGLL